MRIKKKMIALCSIVVFLFSCTSFLISTAKEDITQIAVAAGQNHTVALNSYGMVMSTGDNTYGQCDTWDWNNIIDIKAGQNFTAGLKSDGTVVVTDSNLDVRSWADITMITAGKTFLAGLTKDNKVLLAGTLVNSSDVSSWDNISTISSGYNHLIGLKPSGECVAAGDKSKGQCNVTKDIMGYSIKGIFAGADTTILIKKNNTTEMVGNYSNYDSIKSWTNVQKYIPGYKYVIAVLEDGTCVTNDSSTSIYTAVNNKAVSSIDMGYYDDKDGEHLVYSDSDGDVTVCESLSNNSKRTDVLAWNLFREPLSIDDERGKVFAVKDNLSVVNNSNALMTTGTLFSGIDNIAEIASNYYSVVAGLKYDGTVVLDSDKFPEVSKWKGIVKVSVGRSTSDNGSHIAGLRWNGTVVGTEKYENVASKGFVTDITSGYRFTAMLYEDGKVLYTCENGFNFNDFPESGWKNVKSFSAGHKHLVAVLNDGTLVSAGDDLYDNRKVSDIVGAVDCKCSIYNTMILLNDGSVCCIGSDYKGIKNSNGWEGIKSIAVCNFYAAAVTDDGEVIIATTDTKSQELEDKISKWSIFGKKKIIINSVTKSDDKTLVDCYITGKTKTALYGENRLVGYLSTENNDNPYLMTKETITVDGDYNIHKIKLLRWSELLTPEQSAVVYVKGNDDKWNKIN